MGLITTRKPGSVQSYFQFGRAFLGDAGIVGGNNGVAAILKSYESPLVLTSFQLRAYCVGANNGSIPNVYWRLIIAEVDLPSTFVSTPYQLTDVTGTDGAIYEIPKKPASDLACPILWEEVVVISPTQTFDVAMLPREFARMFTVGPSIGINSAMTIMAFPIVNTFAANYTADCQVTLNVTARGAYNGEQVGTNAGSSNGLNARALPQGFR